MAKNIAHSIKARLLNLGDHDNRRYQQLLVRYLQERFLYRLSQSRHYRNFILKGGTLLYAYDKFLPRPTLDVDLLGVNISNSKESIIEAFKEIASSPISDDGVVFIPESITASDIAVERKYPGIRIMLTTYLDTIKKDLTFDIGFGDVIVPNPIMMTYPTLIMGMDKPQLAAYSLETVIAEKIQTMTEKSFFNSRMKDFFDVYRILLVHEFNSDVLLDAMKATFDNRKTEYSNVEVLFSHEFINDTTMEQRWKTYCKKTKLHGLPSFKETIEVINNFLLPYKRKLMN